MIFSWGTAGAFGKAEEAAGLAEAGTSSPQWTVVVLAVFWREDLSRLCYWTWNWFLHAWWRLSFYLVLDCCPLMLAALPSPRGVILQAACWN